jgi:signal transduction histidine kinase
MVLWVLVSQTAWAGTAPTSVTIQLRWLHQFQFAGYYAALHKGFYKDAGLDVTIKEGSPSISAIDEVTQGRADFGVSNSGLVKSYLEGKPVLMLAPIFQHTPQVLLHLDEKAKTPRDLAQAGAIGLLPGDESLDLKAIFVNEGMVLDKLNISTDGLGLKDLLSGKIVAMNAYLSNEPFLLQKIGMPYHVIDTRQYGIDFYSDVLFTSRAVEKAKPEAVAAFRSATLKGWEYALAHQDEIIGLILAHYNSQAKSREYLVFEAKTLASLIDSDVISLGHSNPGRWRHIVETYAKFGIIKFNFSLDGFFYDPNPPPPDMTWLYRLLAAVMLGLSLIGGVVFYIHRLNRRLHRTQHAIDQNLNEQHQFMDMLTHELKTPISVVTLSLNQMTDQHPQKSVKLRAEKAMDDMNSMVERCQQLDQFEHQKPVLHMQNCHLPDILAQLQQRCASPQRLDITTWDLPELQSDPQLISLVLGNLINNALKYSPALSTVSIEAQAAAEAGRAGILISVQNLPGAAGLPDPAKVFDKYYRSPGAQKQTGTGLGLYLVKSFAALLGGQVSYAVEQQHIRFTLWLPC